jgi:hypothetical protein
MYNINYEKQKKFFMPVARTTKVVRQKIFNIQPNVQL